MGAGNGGDDFTFTFPRGAGDMYRVFALGFEVLDDTDTLNETLSVYDTNAMLLGR